MNPTAFAPVLGAVSTATVGAVVASRRPAHPVGWLLLALGLSLTAAGVTLACNGLTLLLTPTGRLPSPGWRWWAGIILATPMVVLGVVTLSSSPHDRLLEAVDSPLDLRALDGGLLIVYRAAFAVVIIAFVGTAGSLVGGLNPPILAVGIGAAVLRYRLYDLDRIVSRTVAYGLLTLLLGGGYAVVVLGLGELLGQDSSLVVAGATLAAAGLFQPARRRIQAVVDRRFNRRSHDAARTIAAFSDRLREQVDLDTLSAALLAVIDDTMQPNQASLWLRRQASSTAAGRP